ncbi:MAG: hypothetical protein RIA69_04720 [Cyclobacteriaceae bacterium]
MNSNTANFVASGCFTTKFVELEEYLSHSKVLRDKEKNDATLSKLKLRTFWPVLLFGIFGGIYSSIDFYQKITSKTSSVTQEILNNETLKFINLIDLQQKQIDSLNQELNKINLFIKSTENEKQTN